MSSNKCGVLRSLSALGHNLGAVFFFFKKPKDCLSDSAQGRSGLHGGGI